MASDASAVSLHWLTEAAEEIKELLRIDRLNANPIDPILTAYLAGAPIDGVFDTLADADWFKAAVALFAQEPDSFEKLKTQLSLEPDETTQLERMYYRYAPTLGDAFAALRRRTSDGVYNAISKIRVFPLYAADDSILRLRVRLFEGDTVRLESVNDADSVVWLGVRLLTNTLRWLKWCGDQGLPYRAQDLTKLREYSAELAGIAKSYGEVIERISKAQEGGQADEAEDEAE